MCPKHWLTRLMGLSPVLLIGSFAVESRFYEDSFVPEQCTPGQESAISAYVQPVRMTENVLSTREVRAADLRDLARVWILGAKRGRLRPLTPIGTDDSIRSNIKDQIFTANTRLVWRLKCLAEEETTHGQPSVAAQDLIQAMRVEYVIKYSDVYAVSLEGGKERALLIDLAAASKNLSSSEAGQLRANLIALRAPTETAMMRIERQHAQISAHDQLPRETDDESGAGQTLASVSPVLRDYPMARIARAAEKTSAFAHVSHSNRYRPELQVAFGSERRIAASIDQITSSLPSECGR